MTVHDYLTRCGGQLAPTNGVITGLPTATGLGLTTRDWFAGLGVPLAWQVFQVAAEKGDVTDGNGPAFVAAEAYRLADAMLAERAKVLAGG